MKVAFGAVVLGAGAAALVLGASSCGGGGSAQAWSSYRGIAVADPSAAPDVALRDQDGHTVRLSAQRGRFVIVAFLYTQCPDVCLLTAEHLSQAVGVGNRDSGASEVGGQSDFVLEDPFGEEGLGDAVAVLVALDEFVLGECFEGALDG